MGTHHTMFCVLHRGCRVKDQLIPVRIRIVVPVVVTPLLPDSAFVTIVGLDVFLLDATVFVVCASAMIRDVETNQFFERVSS